MAKINSFPAFVGTTHYFESSNTSFANLTPKNHTGVKQLFDRKNCPMLNYEYEHAKFDGPFKTIKFYSVKLRLCKIKIKRVYFWKMLT